MTLTKEEIDKKIKVIKATILKVAKPIPDCEPYRYIGDDQHGYWLIFEDSTYAQTMDGEAVKYPTMDHLKIGAYRFMLRRTGA